MDLKEFGLYFAKLREDSGFKSQRQLAEKSGVSNGTIARIEGGTQEPTPSTLKKLALHLKDVNYEDLMKAAGYIDGDRPDGSSVIREKTAGELYDDPEFQLAMRSAQGFSDENKKKVLEYIEMIEELEKGRKPGDKQPRPKKY